MIKNYLKIALRNLSHRKVFTAINIVGLGLGFACFMLVMLYVNDELSFDRFHKNGPQLYRVVSENTMVKRKTSRQGFPVGPALKNEIPGIQNYVRGIKKNGIIKLKNDVINETIYFYDEGFFTVFSFPLIHGNPSSVLDQVNSIVLTKESAEKYFGSADVVGKELSMKTDSVFESFIVTGVAENIPQNSSIQFDFILPMSKYEKTFTVNPNWMSFNVNTFVLLKPNVNPKQVEAGMPGLVKKYVKKGPLVYSLQNIKDIHLDASFTDMGANIKTSNPVYSYILTGIAIFVLVISCINFVNLSVGLSLRRAKEIGVRKVVGAVRKQLIVQFIAESFLLCTLAFLFSLLLVKISLPLFNQLSSKQLSLSYLYDNTDLILASITLLLITSLAAGSYPALIISRFKPVDILYSKLQLTGKNIFTKYLVVVQFCLTIFLITITFIFQSQFNLLINKNLGYDDKNMVQVRLPDNGQITAEIYKNELLKNDNITEVVSRSGDLYIDGARAEGKEIGTAILRVDENYLSALKIPILTGRSFSNSFSTDSTGSVIVNESFAREAGWIDPIGKRVSLGDSKATIVGMVKDYHFQSLHDKIVPQVLHYGIKSQPLNEALIRIKPENIPQTLAFIERTFKSLTISDPFEYSFLEQINETEYASERQWKLIISNATVLSILISCLGLFGLTSLSIVRRTKEIGIRKILGASPTGITLIVAREFVKLVVVAFIISIPLTWYSANKWLEDFPYRVNIAWWMFLSAGCSAVIIALLTVSFQAIRAAVSNPVKSLRSE